jgi:hypothetical protein
MCIVLSGQIKNIGLWFRRGFVWKLEPFRTPGATRKVPYQFRFGLLICLPDFAAETGREIKNSTPWRWHILCDSLSVD